MGRVISEELHPQRFLLILTSTLCSAYSTAFILSALPGIVFRLLAFLFPRWLILFFLALEVCTRLKYERVGIIFSSSSRRTFTTAVLSVVGSGFCSRQMAFTLMRCPMVLAVSDLFAGLFW